MVQSLLALTGYEFLMWRRVCSHVWGSSFAFFFWRCSTAETMMMIYMHRAKLTLSRCICLVDLPLQWIYCLWSANYYLFRKLSMHREDFWLVNSGMPGRENWTKQIFEVVTLCNWAIKKWGSLDKKRDGGMSTHPPFPVDSVKCVPFTESTLWLL